MNFDNIKGLELRSMALLTQSREVLDIPVVVETFEAVCVFVGVGGDGSNRDPLHCNRVGVGFARLEKAQHLC